MMLNDLERRNSPYFAFLSPNSIALQANYVTVVEDRPVKYCLPVPVFHFWPKLTHPAARFLCDSWATWIYITVIGPVFEYCARVWHYALRKAQSERLMLSKSAPFILCTTRGMPYSSVLFLFKSQFSGFSQRRSFS